MMKKKQGCEILAEMTLTHFRVSIFYILLLSLDEPMMKVVLFAYDGEEDNEEVIRLPSTSS